MTLTPSCFKWLSTMALVAPMHASHAQSNAIPACPVQITESSVKLGDVGAGWRPYIAAPLLLHSVAPSDGPPERLGQLVGKQARNGRDAWTDTYDLRGDFPEGKWLQCGYGMLNEVVLSKRLDDRVTSCTIKGRKGDKAGQNVFSVECR